MERDQRRIYRLRSDIKSGKIRDLKSILKEALEYGDVQVVELLLTEFLNPNLRFYGEYNSTSDRSPLDIAIETNNLDMINVILKAGASPNSQDHNGNTALLIALQVPYDTTPRVVQLLMLHGANPHIPNDEKNTAYTMLEAHRRFLGSDRYHIILNFLDNYRGRVPEQNRYEQQWNRSAKYY